MWPAEGAPAHVDAIVMLAGDGDTVGVALQLARQHRAPVLVVSQGWMGYGGPCPPKTSDATVICFEPNPGNTRGEAQFVGGLAKRYHWRSMVLVTIPGPGHARPRPDRTLLRRLGLRDKRLAALVRLALPDRL